MSTVAERNKSLQLLMVEGSTSAREHVILANQELVRYVIKSLGLNAFDEDLFQIGCIGLIKAVDSFDFEKNIKFATYAVRVIRNEILMTLRKKRVPISFSLDDIKTLDNGEEVSYGEIISDGKDFEGTVVESLYMQSFLHGLNERDRKIICQYIMEHKKQNEIASELGISQAWISRLLKSIRNKYEV